MLEIILVQSFVHFKLKLLNLLMDSVLKCIGKSRKTELKLNRD